MKSIYCYNTFWLRQLNKLTKSKWNSINFIGWMEWRWVDLLMAAAPIKENKFSFNLRVMGYEFGPQSSTQSHLSSHSTFNCLYEFNKLINSFLLFNKAKEEQSCWNGIQFERIEWISWRIGRIQCCCFLFFIEFVKHWINFPPNRSSASGAPCGSVLGRFCVFIM